MPGVERQPTSGWGHYTGRTNFHVLHNPQNCLVTCFMGGFPRDLRRHFADAHSRSADAIDFRQHRAVSGAVVGQCGIAVERRNTALAPERFLDVAGDELHTMDDRAVRVDVLRSLSAQVSAKSLPRRHRLLSARHSGDGGTGVAPTPEAWRTAHAAGVSG